MRQQEIRLQKYLSDCGVLSRRAAEKAILAQEITVNDVCATLGQKINPATDKVKYQGRLIKKPRSQRYTYLMLHKPKGYVTTMSDEKGRKCVAELVADADARVYPVGRLDMDSEGILLFTNDGELANALTHPSHHIAKEYHVRVSPRITRPQLRALGESMEIDGYQIQPVQTTLLSQAEESSLLRMVLYEGRNRQIRKMCEQVELQVLRLKRVAIGDLELEGLKKGAWRYLTYEEMQYLKQACGLGGKKNVRD